MSIFGLGITELLLVAIIAMIVAGPKRLMAWMYILGRFLGQMRIMWRQAMEAVQKEIDEAGIDFQLPKDPTNRTEMQRFAQNALRPLREPMEKAMREVDEERKQLEKALREPNQALTDAVKDIAREGEDVAEKNGTLKDAPLASAFNEAESTPDATTPPLEKTADPQRPAGFGTWSAPSMNEHKEG